jgi:hypothetical protein
MSLPPGYPVITEFDGILLNNSLTLQGATTIYGNTAAIMYGQCGSVIELQGGAQFNGLSGSNFTLFDRGISGPMDYKGDWESGRTYQKHDVITWAGATDSDSRSYVVTTNSTTLVPSNTTAWSPLSPPVPPGLSGTGNIWFLSDLRNTTVPGGSGPPTVGTFFTRSLTNQEHPSYVGDIGFTGGVQTLVTENDRGRTGLWWLPEGTYQIRSRAPGWSCGGHQSRIHRFEPAASEAFFYGTSELAPNNANASTAWSVVEIMEEVPSGQTYGYSLQHAVQVLPSAAARRQSVFGSPASVGTTERYSTVSIRQVLPFQP